MLVLDLEGSAAGTYHWAVRVVEGSHDGRLQILDRFVSAMGEELEFAWPGAE